MIQGKLKYRAQGRVSFYCPGCKEHHTVNIEGNYAWGFNQNNDKPTFTPSIKVTGGHYVDGFKGVSCWCTWNKEHPEDQSQFACKLCHSFIMDGTIQFLGDCSHELANQTVDLPDYPEDEI